MAGYIVYNGFWNPVQPPDPVRRLVAAAAERGVLLTPRPNTALTADIRPAGIAVNGFSQKDFALFWDKDIRLGQALTACGVRLYNPIDAIAVCDDKSATHLALARSGIPMPRTLLAPMTYRKISAPIEDFLQKAAETLGFPMIVKECYGSLGGQVYLAKTPPELRRLCMGMDSRPFLVQEFLSHAAGEDIRVYVVGDKAVAAMHRRSKGDFRSNIGMGGTGTPHRLTAIQEELALRCCRSLGLSFGGIDLLWDEAGNPLVCEVNSNAFMGEITACTGVDVAGRIVEYVLEQENQINKRPHP